MNVPDIPVPLLMSRLKRDRRGFPIPFTAMVDAKGVPDFKVTDMERWVKCLKLRLCGICGARMTGRAFFVGGPACEKNRMFFDHPMHEECATYALQVCPFLALSRAHYGGGKLAPGNALIMSVSGEKPDRFMLGKTRNYRLVRFGEDALLQADPWEEPVLWWKDGKLLQSA